MIPLMNLPARGIAALGTRWGAFTAVLAACVCILPAADLPLAIPAALAPDWVADPAGAFRRMQEDNATLVKNYQSLLSAVTIGAWMAGAALTVLGIARAIPGPSKALAELAWAMFAPKLTKEAEGKQKVYADGFIAVSHILRSFPTDSPLGDVIEKLDRRLPDEVKLAYQEWAEENATSRPPSREDLKEVARIRAEAAAEVVAEVAAGARKD